ncbi:MAG TPA: hypothetical protein VK582_07835 [Pyrinomonadaceae bacterium]|nr:hypothetical protein [Pyrinomonadaceae bacterium]
MTTEEGFVDSWAYDNQDSNTLAERINFNRVSFGNEPFIKSRTKFLKMLLEKKLLAKVYGIAPERVRLIDGGYRKWRTIELWIVPRGEDAPVPTPNSFPPGRRRPSR